MLETPFSWAHGLNLTLAGYSQLKAVLLITRLPALIPVKQSLRTARPIRTRLMLPCVATRFSAVREY
jgi:hypothetical protein